MYDTVFAGPVFYFESLYMTPFPKLAIQVCRIIAFSLELIFEHGSFKALLPKLNELRSEVQRLAGGRHTCQ